MLCHRVDFQNELLHLATREDGPGKACKLELGEQVVACDPEFGSITLKNGMIVTADVIIGADGIRSTVNRISPVSIATRTWLTSLSTDPKLNS
jgi:salicylate hydroxylase